MINDRQITISVGASRKSTDWRPQTLTLSALYERLSQPVRSTETISEYLSMTKGEQDQLKDIGGFVAGTLSGPRRKADAVVGRDVLTLDLDTIPAHQTDSIIRRMGELGPGYCIYSTRKHQPAAPRLRVLIPLDRTATAEEYEAVARKTAEWIDMTVMDPTTFEPSRLMYWGSCCSDGEWVFRWADKPFLSVDGVLATYENWHDTTSWPRVAGEATPQRLARRQTDPTTKRGLVGAFCRTYNVVQAMDLIPGTYEPAGQDRYTYLGGSTTGGAVLYDDDKFLFSHHATDPCSGQLVNAWDMVRLHKFGHLDDEALPGTVGISLPSYKAMAEYARADSAVSATLEEEAVEEIRRAFQPTGGEEAAQGIVGADNGAWMHKLKLNRQNAPENCMTNLQIVLMNDPQLKGRMRLNLFSGRVEINGTTPWKRPGTSPVINDDDLAHLRIYLEKVFGKVAKNDVADAIAAVASDQAYHPVRDYLVGLEWDGVPRLDTLFIDYLGALDTTYTRAITRKSLVAAVARIMHPGCKYDTMVVLVGKQGRHKSTILAKLGGEYFSDSLRTFGDKDSMETIQGTWINEVAEMQAMNRAEVDAVKMFLSKTSDYYRAAYAKYTADRPRQCVLFGTTNSTECLVDLTGGRRFWVCDIDQQDRTKDVFRDLDHERDQIWAEAVVQWQQHEPLHLPPQIEEVARELQEEHRTLHPWEDIIHNFLEEDVPAAWADWDAVQRSSWRNGGLHYDGGLVPRSRVCAQEIWCEALDRKKGDMRKTDSREINAILEKQPGWSRAGRQRAGAPYGMQRCFKRDLSR